MVRTSRNQTKLGAGILQETASLSVLAKKLILRYQSRKIYPAFTSVCLASVNPGGGIEFL